MMDGKKRLVMLVNFFADPDVQISRFRFFMGEPRSWWCNGWKLSDLSGSASCETGTEEDRVDPGSEASIRSYASERLTGREIGQTCSSVLRGKS
jgi:hypothetical protein